MQQMSNGAEPLYGAPPLNAPHKGWEANVHCAFDLRTQFIVSAGERYFGELADVYRKVFNCVKAVEAKWTEQGARDLIKFHAGTPGCNLVLFNQRDEKIVGGFLSNIVPSAKGWKLSTWDIFVDEKNDRTPHISQDLYTASMIEAGQICARDHGSGITSSYSTTYKKSLAHRRLWQGKGYVLSALFNLTAKDILAHERSSHSDNVNVVHAHPEDAEQIADFIAGNGTISSDGESWQKPQAVDYVAFMFKYHPSTFVVAKQDNKIVAVSSLNIIPTRSSLGSDPALPKPGVTGVEPLCFVNTDTQEERIALTRATYMRLFHFATGAAMHVWRQGFTSIEVPSQSEQFFRAAFPDMREDDEFLGGVASPEVMRKDFMPASGTNSRVSVVPYLKHERTDHYVPL
jgi:hypothetical protein